MFKQRVYDVSEFIEVGGRSSLGYFKNKHNEVFDILKITGTRGLKQMPIDEIHRHINEFLKEIRHIKFGMTFIVLDSLMDFTPQVNYYQHRMKFCENDAQKEWLQYEIDKLSLQYQGHVSEENYYVLVFAPSQKELLESRDVILRSRYLNADEVAHEDKVALLYQLHNRNS